MTNVPTSGSSRALTIALFIALGAGLLFVLPFLSIIVLAALLAFLFYPTYRRIGRVVKSPRLAATITLIISGVFILIPVGIVLIITVSQLTAFSGSVTSYLGAHGGELPPGVRDAIQTINTTVEPLTHTAIVTDQGVKEFIVSTIPDILRTFGNILIGIMGSIPLVVILSIMYIILFMEFLVYKDSIVRTLYQLSPFDRPVTHTYLTRIQLMTNAMAKGQLLISIVISFLSALLMIPLGLGHLFFIFFVVFTVLNLIPLGCGILVIPICLIAIAMGNVVPGVVVLLLYILVSNLDSIMRPRLMPKSVQLSAGLTMIAAFSGITFFGLLGVVYGPVIMIVITTTIQLYVTNAGAQKTVPHLSRIRYGCRAVKNRYRPSSCFFFAANSSSVRIPLSRSSANCLSASTTSTSFVSTGVGATG